ncbi:cation:proton antiporter [Sphingomonas naphthae]|uniref:Cation:proton antiporter n=1 Tax=Sphingomonas naphthae TaxID=1813468 RepID=A0ABY7TMJ1_9SPHN|nr:cation:proton antiporter [Sphingomonas naphthae]WCT73059.1 cation:proton antiporter [Sphingomonas naphthae]
MADASLGQTIGPAVTLMAAAVIAVPLFRRLGLGSVLGYFTAGVLVGPSVLGFFTDTRSILHFSELGVVMFLFLFVIGLELRPHKLWAMRGQIFGLGSSRARLRRGGRRCPTPRQRAADRAGAGGRDVGPRPPASLPDRRIAGDPMTFKPHNRARIHPS